MSKWCHQTHEVEFHECDHLANGVHNAAYFIWFERARFQIVKDLGLMELFQQNADELDDTLIFPVLEAECKYIHTIPVGTVVSVRTRLEKPKMAQLIFHHVVTDVDTGLDYCTGKTTVGIVSHKNGFLLNLDKRIKDFIALYLKG